MRISPIVLLLLAMLGCGSGTKPTEPPAPSGGNQVQQKQAASPTENIFDTAPKPINLVPNSPKAKAATKASIQSAVSSSGSDLNLRNNQIDLHNEQITDLTPLVGLTELDVLFLSDNQITDLTPLAGLTKAEYLELSGNQITILTPLARLTNLGTLELSDNQITDLTPLAGLTKLGVLQLGDNQITDLTPLARLTKLGVLHLFDNQITDLTPLAGLAKLKWLYLGNNQITDLKPLAGLTKLEELWLNDNPNLTEAEIGKLQKVLPNCKIEHNATK